MGAAVLSEEERLDWLRLIRTDGVGPRTFRTLLARCGSARAALEALPDLARRGGRGGLKIATRAEAERELVAASRLRARFLALGEPLYPKALQAIDTAPPLIAVRGDPDILSRPCAAIVGSRNASAAGLAFAERLARGLGEAGYVVASGLARGIDTRAHKGSCATGTIAVLAGGQDRVYPQENEPLLQAILDAGGAVVSEMPFGCEPRARDFPRRNRIVAGLSLGVVVVEAARRSGSLITAQLALEQGREVFAVPGSPLDPRAEGTNDLIRAGASLCASAEHVTAVLGPLVASGGQPAPPQLLSGFGAPTLEWDELVVEGDGAAPASRLLTQADDAEAEDTPPGSPESMLVGLLGPSPIAVDELVRQSGLAPRLVHMHLLELEVAGRLERHGGNAVSLVPRA